MALSKDDDPNALHFFLASLDDAVTLSKQTGSDANKMAWRRVNELAW